MIEVEIKLPVKDPEKLTADLEQQGFHKKKSVTEKDVYYTGLTHDCRARDEALRIRTIQEEGMQHSVITFKGPKLDSVSMTRTELETALGDPVIMDRILQALDYRPAGRVVKKREYYHYGHLTACVDDVEGLGHFLELEILSENEKQREEALREMDECLRKCGLSMQDTVRTSYLSMLQKQSQ